MNHPLEPGTSTAGTRSRLRAEARPLVDCLAVLLCSLALGVGGTGCSFLKPAKPTARHFVLTPLPAAGPAAPSPGGPAIGVGPVKVPGYLFDTSLAVRHETNRIEYLPSILWAERLDTGLQRVLGANLAVLLPTDRVRLSAWRSEDVGAEVYVVITRFDVDATGRGELVAWWRVLSPGGEKTLKAGESRLTRDGPPPESDPSGAVATLSNLTSDLSRQLAQALREAMSGPAAPGSK